MRITPKLALTITAMLLAVGLLWVGFVEGGRSQIPYSRGSQAAGVAGQNPNQFIAAGAMAASAVPGFGETGASPATRQPQDNVPALALSGSVIAALVMLALGFTRFQEVQRETAGPGRTRLIAVGTPRL